MSNKSIDTDTFKILALEILSDFGNICKKHNLRYSVAYGTLLGAVRHKGYIPWDDDIDVIMPREDFMKFLKFSSELSSSHSLISIYNNKLFSAPLAKIINNKTLLKQNYQFEKTDLGVYIDIFVFDKIPENSKKVKKAFFIASFFQKMWNFSGCELNPQRKTGTIEKKLRIIASKLGIARRASILMDYYAKTSIGLKWGNLMFSVYKRKKDILQQDAFDNLIQLPFENLTVLAFADYKKYLRNWYNDYMKLPPIEERTLRHTYELYWK